MSLLSVLITALLLGLPAPLDDDDDAVAAAQRPLYPLDTCLVSGEALGDMGDVVEVVQDDRLVRLCCKGCVKQLSKDPAPLIEALDAAAVAAQSAHYPLDTCVVSGEALGDEPGDVVDVVHEGRYVKLCCKGCVKQLRKDPAAVIAKLDAAAIAMQLPHYPLDTCLVSGEPLGDAPVDVLHGTTLVRLCCNGCKKQMAKDPAPVIEALHAAYMRAHPEHGRDGEHGHDGEHDGAREHDGHGER